MNFFIGIDASLSSTGIVVLDGRGEIYSRMIISSKLTGTERLKDLSKKTKEYLSNFVPCRLIPVFLENYSFGSRAGQAFSIGEWGGVLRVLLNEMGFKVTGIAPTVLKKFITGKGNAKKEQMLLQTFKKFGQEFDNNDICDAFGLALLCYKFFNRDKLKLSESEKEIIGKIGKK
jgi:crossover junction endodeoxyribonuclease RuvC